MYAGKVAAMLDKVADSLEAKGYTKEAEELDVIANTIEKEAGVLDAFRKGLRSVAEVAKKIPGVAVVFNKLKSMTPANVFKFMKDKLGKITGEDFDKYISYLLDPTYTSRSASDDVAFGAAFIALLAGMRGKAIDQFEFNEFIKMQDEIYAQAEDMAVPQV